MSAIEIRYAGKVIDEVVADCVAVQLEHMGDHWSLIIDHADGSQVNLSLTTRKAILVEKLGNIKEVRS